MQGKATTRVVREQPRPKPRCKMKACRYYEVHIESLYQKHSWEYAERFESKKAALFYAKKQDGPTCIVKIELPEVK